jgi:hypothetical protein
MDKLIEAYITKIRHNMNRNLFVILLGGKGFLCQILQRQSTLWQPQVWTSTYLGTFTCLSKASYWAYY